MKVEDLHTLKIVHDKRGWIELNKKIDEAAATIWSGRNPDPGEFQSCDDATKAAALFRASHKMQAELRHLVNPLEPLEKAGGLNVPGLATLNGARSALALSENTAETVTP